MSYDDIRSYLDGLIANEALKVGGERIHDIRLNGEIIKTSQIQTFTSGKRAGLQIADAVASSCFYGLEPSRVGYIESRYVEMLKPVIYTRGGKTLSYGMKFFPVGIDQIANEDTRLKNGSRTISNKKSRPWVSVYPFGKGCHPQRTT